MAQASLAAGAALAIGSLVGPSAAIATPAPNALTPAKADAQQIASVSIILGDRSKPQRLYRSRQDPHSGFRKGVVLQGDGFSIRLGGDGGSGSALYYRNPSHHPAYRQHIYRHPAAPLRLPRGYNHDHFRQDPLRSGDRGFNHPRPSRQHFHRGQYRIQQPYYHQYKLRKLD